MAFRILVNSINPLVFHQNIINFSSVIRRFIVRIVHETITQRNVRSLGKCVYIRKGIPPSGARQND